MRLHPTLEYVAGEAGADPAVLHGGPPGAESAAGGEGFRCWFLLGTCLGWLALDGCLAAFEFAGPRADSSPGLQATKEPAPVARPSSGPAAPDLSTDDAGDLLLSGVDPPEPESAEVFELPRLSPRELRNFPGIGERRAIAIARARWEHASSPDPLFLDQIEGIGSKTVESVAQFLSEQAAGAAAGP